MPSEKTEKLGDLIGKVTHYFPKAEVAVIDLAKTLSVGDEVRIIGGIDTDFNQTVKSMEIEHKQVKKAKPGDEVALRTEQKVREGYKVYKG